MAPFGNLPEVVIYTEFGREHKALVIGSRELEHHAGENGEPLLNLVFVKPLTPDACANCGNRRAFHGKPSPAHLRVCAEFVEPDPVPTNNDDLVHIVTDVAHESHEFTAAQLDALHKQNITIAQAYPGNAIPGGRWREANGNAGGLPIPQAAPVEEASDPSPTVPTGGSETPPVVN